MMRNFRILFIIFFVTISISVYSQGIPEYRLDGSNVIWFIHISDTHVDSDALKYYKDYFPWLLNEAIPIINPSFVINTGDLTDSTRSTFPYYGFGPIEEEWIKYKEIYTNALMTPSFYYDCPGNHDAYGDGQLVYYLKYSLQGSFTNSTQASWYIDNGRGIYHFFYAATTANDGKQWPSDNQELTDDELIQIDRFLKENPEADMRIAFAHHDYEKEDVKNKDRFLILLKQYGISYFGNGHEHDLGFRIGDGNIVKYRVDSLGQSEGNNVGIWVIDNYNVTVKTFKAMDMFPVAVITAPADVILDDPKEKIENPYIPPVPVHCNSAPVRALVFSRSENPEVYFKIDNGSNFLMSRRKTNKFQFRGYFDATKLSTGLHTITVTVKTDNVRETKNEFYISDIPCELGKEDPDEIVLDDAGLEVLEDIYNSYNDVSEDYVDDVLIYDAEGKLISEDIISDYSQNSDISFIDDDSIYSDAGVKMDIYNFDITINKPDQTYSDSGSDESGCGCNYLN